MELAHIAPTSALKTAIMQTQSFNLALAHQVLQDKEYAAHYASVPGFVMLDVPTREWKNREKPFDTDLLCQAIETIHPNEVVLPDLWGSDSDKAIEIAHEVARVLPYMTKRGPLGYLAVPRGSSWEEYLYCATAMSQIEGVSTIGVPDGTYEKFQMPRLRIVEEFKHRFPDKEVHLLGVRRDFTDIQDKLLRRLVRSADTAKIVMFSLLHKRPVYGNIPDYPGRMEGYFEKQITELDESYLVRNIRYWNRLVEN